jgi:dTDP-4-dehydrorhamnose 3,5-epimerase
MKVNKLSLEGSYELIPGLSADKRGHFFKIFGDEIFNRHELNAEWKQSNISFNLLAGTLRGMHFQKDPFSEVKLVTCMTGSAYDVIIDLRPKSSTYGCFESVTLDSNIHNMVYIPKGFAHGFQTLEPETTLLYLHSSSYKPTHESGVVYNDPELSIPWPLPVSALSSRDSSLTCLKNLGKNNDL